MCGFPVSICIIVSPVLLMVSIVTTVVLALMACEDRCDNTWNLSVGLQLGCTLESPGEHLKNRDTSSIQLKWDPKE